MTARRPRRVARTRRRRSPASRSIAVPMVLFLVLNIGSIFYALYISLWRLERPIGAGQVPGPRELRGRCSPTPIFQRAIKNSLYYAVVWVPLTMAIGLFLAVIVNQKIRGPDVLPGGLLLPGDRQLGGDHDRCGSSSSRRTACSTTSAGRSGSTRCSTLLRVRAEPELDRRPGHRAELGDHPQRLDDLRHVHALLPGLAPVDQRARSTRRPRSTARAPGRRSGRSPSRCSARATTSWRPSRSSGRCSCSTRRSSAAGRTATRTTR